MINKKTAADLTHDQREHIERLATAFRRAIEQCDPVQLPITLQNFPRGACGDAAMLLAQYLHDQGYGRAQYVLGNRDG